MRSAMETKEDNAIPPEVLADLKEILRQVASFGRVTDQELIRRVQERSRKAQEEDLRQYGVRDIAVDLIRESRDEE